MENLSVCTETILEKRTPYARTKLEWVLKGSILESMKYRKVSECSNHYLQEDIQEAWQILDVWTLKIYRQQHPTTKKNKARWKNSWQFKFKTKILPKTPTMKKLIFIISNPSILQSIIRFLKKTFFHPTLTKTLLWRQF